MGWMETERTYCWISQFGHCLPDLRWGGRKIVTKLGGGGGGLGAEGGVLTALSSCNFSFCGGSAATTQLPKDTYNLYCGQEQTL